MPDTTQLKMLTLGPDLACTLEAAEAGERISEWHVLAGHATSRRTLPDGVRLILPPTADLMAVADLVRRERSCCGFLSFGLHATPTEIELEITGPPGSGAVIGALLGD